MNTTKQSILNQRLHRQRLVEPASTDEEYAAMFRELGPVSPVYFSMPGSPPSLVHRAGFDDMVLCDEWRQRREIVKGRFLGGTIGYVFSDELELYANAFARPMARLNQNQELVYETLLHVGPLTPQQIKEETGLLNKEIMPILHRLQEAFLVYEDQVDSDWERAWYVFSEEWPDIAIEPDRWEDAAQEVLRRFLQAHVFATTENVKDWSGWPLKDVKMLLGSMEADGAIVSHTIDGLGQGWTLAEDVMLRPHPSPLPQERELPNAWDLRSVFILHKADPLGHAEDVMLRPHPNPLPQERELSDLRSVFMLHRADPLVRANVSELNRRFKGLEVLQYLLIDGDFKGAVCGHWRIGPHDVDNIVVELDPDERESRKTEIIEAVAWKYHPPQHRILGYAGEKI